MNLKICYLGNYLGKYGHTPQVCETLSDLFSRKGLRVFKGGRFKNRLLRFIDIHYVLFRNRSQTDFILIDTFSGSAFVWAFASARLARLFKIPYIPILHGGNLPAFFAGSWKYFGKKYLMDAHKVVAPSPYMSDWGRSMGCTPIIIPNPIPISEYPYSTLQAKENILLWARRFHSIYNPQLAILAFHQFLKIMPDFEMIMAGAEGDELTDCLNLTQSLGLESKIHFPGLLSKRKLIEYGLKSAAFINTSNYDNIPVTLVEMAALGLPIISTEVGGLSKVFTHKSDIYFVPPNNPKKLADAIKSVLTDPSLIENLARNARVLSLNFSEDSAWNKWESLFSIQ